MTSARADAQRLAHPLVRLSPALPRPVDPHTVRGMVVPLRYSYWLLLVVTLAALGSCTGAWANKSTGYREAPPQYVQADDMCVPGLVTTMGLPGRPNVDSCEDDCVASFNELMRRIPPRRRPARQLEVEQFGKYMAECPDYCVRARLTRVVESGRTQNYTWAECAPGSGGCCSHHGGICGLDGIRIACCDGQRSPTCFFDGTRMILTR